MRRSGCRTAIVLALKAASSPRGLAPSRACRPATAVQLHRCELRQESRSWPRIRSIPMRWLFRCRRTPGRRSYVHRRAFGLHPCVGCHRLPGARYLLEARPTRSCAARTALAAGRPLKGLRLKDGRRVYVEYGAPGRPARLMVVPSAGLATVTVAFSRETKGMPHLLGE